MLFLALFVVTCVPFAAEAQTLVDTTKRIVGSRAILASDIRIVKELKLLPSSAGSEDEILTDYENRMLAVAFVDRVPGLPEPSPEEVIERRKQWESALGGDATARLAAVYMSEPDLMTWLRDDTRLEKYEKQRFGREADPAKARNDWILGLRKQAGLK
jgi:hypothetical protein